MIDELINSPSNSPAIGGIGSGGHACGVGRIYFTPSIPPTAGLGTVSLLNNLQGITPWCDRLQKRLEETFCEVVND